MSEPVEIGISIRSHPELATPALWSKLYALFDVEESEPVKRPAAHWIDQWAPHWSWPWDQAISVEIFEARLMLAIQASRVVTDA